MSHSEILVTDADPAATPEWWKSAVVYQIYPRSFQDSDGDGVGDLRGILGRLDHLRRLGVDVIWLSPIYRSPQADNGYDISDYQQIDSVFGTLDDFDELLAAVHARGMKLVMDLVVNHTSDEHPWFLQSRAGRDSPKRDWYIWRPPREGCVPGEPGSEPTNWESFFSGPTWTLDETSGEYYLHLFASKQPDLNWDNPDVREAVYTMMRWWLDRGVDGFRMDVINLISKHPDLPDGLVPEGKTHGDGFPHFSAGPRLHEYLREMRREVFDGRGALLTVGETPGVTKAEAALFSDPSRRELDMVFQFEHVSLDHVDGKFRSRRLEPGELADSFAEWQEALATVGWNSLYLSNHDQPRPVTRFGDAGRWWRESATALATALHMQRGTPYIYQGEELGMTNAPFRDIRDYRDVESLNYYAYAMARGERPEEVIEGLQAMSRDHARTPVQWDGTENAGFTGGSPWIGVNPNHATVNAERQYGDGSSVFEHYRALIDLRHRLPVVADGDFVRLDTADPAVFAFERNLGDEHLLVLVNLSSEPASPGIPARERTRWRGAEPILVNLGGGSDPDAALAPWEARVYLR
ncbi:glucohydrolase [Microbacterium aurum]|uniref:Glucohydrolase n=1 Tax=Microbacterium aurum TaxID=36805 RepID=A0A1P8U5J4_9MICO|nr:alpha-glucosidase [Microbacterium aurum]APZ33384.1 glucohydrolase [Microbacterium aurum]MBM7827034.1 oligo-1,6-glucosidase [Microbacterium aurum]